MNKKRVLGLYHSADLDGKCSGAIIRKWCELKGHECTLIGINYGDATPWDAINTADLVIISDFCLPRTVMQQIDSERDLLWYDHHKTAIAEMEGYAVFGLQRIEQAGCELTWMGLFPDKPIPPVVAMLGAYDCWRWTDLPEEDRERVLNLQYGMRLDARWPEDSRWLPMLSSAIPVDVIMHGETVRKYQAQQMARINKSGRLIEWRGRKWFTINTHNCSSTDYELVRDELGFDGVLIFYRGSTGWCYSMRSFIDELDVSVMARAYAGGGHAKAAGFHTERLLEELA